MVLDVVLAVIFDVVLDVVFDAVFIPVARDAELLESGRLWKTPRVPA